MTQTTVTHNSDTKADELIQKLEAIRVRLENENHESLKNFVDAVEEADALHEKSSSALDEIVLDMDMLESDTPPSQGE